MCTLRGEGPSPQQQTPYLLRKCKFSKRKKECWNVLKCKKFQRNFQTFEKALFKTYSHNLIFFLFQEYIYIQYTFKKLFFSYMILKPLRKAVRGHVLYSLCTLHSALGDMSSILYAPSTLSQGTCPLFSLHPPLSPRGDVLYSLCSLHSALGDKKQEK